MDLPMISQELLLQRKNLHKNKVDRNRLLLIAVVNIITFLCAIFSMAYYKWIYVEIEFNKFTPILPQRYKLWVSLLYVSIQETETQVQNNYLSYPQIQDLICPQGDSFCLAFFYELDFVGKLCFGIFTFAFLISTYALKDVVTRSKFFMENNSAVNFKNNYRTLVMIVTYLIGLTLNYQAMNLIETNEYSYGLSFWIFVASLVVLAVVVIYQNRKMSQISREELVLKLIQNQKAILRVSKASDGNKSDTFVI